MAEDSWVRTTIRFPRQLHSALKKEAGALGRTIEDLVCSAVERELSGPDQDRFSEIPQGNERMTLRSLERSLQENLDMIRMILAVPDSQGHDFLMEWADRFLECVPAPVVIRELDGTCSWKNPSFLATFNEADEDENFADLDYPPDRLRGFRVVELKAVRESEVTPERILFESWQFALFDANGKQYKGDLLLPHGSVENALRGQGVLLPVPSRQSSTPEIPMPDKLLRGRQAAFLERLPISAVIKDLGGRYLWANKAMLDEVEHEREWSEIIGKKLIEWWFPQKDAAELAAAVDEQEELVRIKKTGYLVSTRVKDHLTRPGLRFPLLDSQQRVVYLGTLGLGQPILFPKTPPETDAEVQ